MMKRDQTIMLSGDRRLGYNEYGDLTGTPLFYFHGWPSCRLEGDLFDLDAIGVKSKIRIITPDRPGMGLSAFQPERTLTDWPHDVLALADSLGIDHFAVLGYSGGSVYSAVTAFEMTDRVTMAGIVSCAGPYTQPDLVAGLAPSALQLVDASRSKPFVGRLIFRMMNLMARFTPDRFIANALSSLPEPDKAFLADSTHAHDFAKMVKEATRQGPRGAQLDTALIGSPWDFGLEKIMVPVCMWQGEVDQNATAAMARYTAAAIPGSQLTVYPGEGHLSVLANHLEQILAALTHQ